MSRGRDWLANETPMGVLVNAMSDLRWFLEELRRNNELLEIKNPVSTRYEAAFLMKKHDTGPALLFERVRGHRNRLVSGICGSRKRISMALGAVENEILDLLINSMRNPSNPKVSSDGPVKEVQEKPRLDQIPILRHYEKDGGAYITSGIVSAKSLDDRVENVSIHRMMVVDRDHLSIRIVPRHLYRLCQMAQEHGSKSLDIGIAIGIHPAVTLAASSPLPFGVSEYKLASALMHEGLELTTCEHVDACVPSDAELVLEGKILLGKQVSEGPLVDITGTYDIVRKQPLVQVVGIMHRKDYVYQALLPGGAEHRLLMGLPFESKILDGVRAVVPSVKGVRLTPGGCCWLHAIISIEKQTEGDGKNALLAAFASHPSLKHAVVVDTDIDIDKLQEVEWAIATRFQGDKDLIVIPNARGSTLDPSSNQELALTTKVGVDATRSLLKPKEKFLKATIPSSD